MYFWTSYLSYKLRQKLIVSYMQLKRLLTSCSEAPKLGKSPGQGQTVWGATWTAYLSAVWCLDLFPPCFLGSQKSPVLVPMCPGSSDAHSAPHRHTHWDHCHMPAPTGTCGNLKFISKKILFPFLLLPSCEPTNEQWVEPKLTWRLVPPRMAQETQTPFQGLAAMKTSQKEESPCDRQSLR